MKIKLLVFVKPKYLKFKFKLHTKILLKYKIFNDLICFNNIKNHAKKILYLKNTKKT